jgi:hypothetical protein
MPRKSKARITAESKSSAAASLAAKLEALRLAGGSAMDAIKLLKDEDGIKLLKDELHRRKPTNKEQH